MPWVCRPLIILVSRQFCWVYLFFFSSLQQSKPNNCSNPIRNKECKVTKNICETRKTKNKFSFSYIIVNNAHFYVTCARLHAEDLLFMSHFFYFFHISKHHPPYSLFWAQRTSFGYAGIFIVIHAIVPFLRHDLLFGIRFIFHYAKYGQCRSLHCICIDYYFVCAMLVSFGAT